MLTPKTALLAAALMLAGLDPASADCTTLMSPGKKLGASIGLIYDPAVAPEWLAGAIGYWTSCAGYGRGFPAFLPGPAAPDSRVVKIRFETRSQTRRCASFHGSTITLYAYAEGKNGRPVPCRDLAQNLAHELGHVLGLNDAGDDHRCRYHIMGCVTPQKPWRRVHAEECRLVDQRWLTPSEEAAPVIAELSRPGEPGK